MHKYSLSVCKEDTSKNPFESVKDEKTRFSFS